MKSAGPGGSWEVVEPRRAKANRASAFWLRCRSDAKPGILMGPGNRPVRPVPRPSSGCPASPSLFERSFAGSDRAMASTASNSERTTRGSRPTGPCHGRGLLDRRLNMRLRCTGAVQDNARRAPHWPGCWQKSAAATFTRCVIHRGTAPCEADTKNVSLCRSAELTKP
jgi:hypothetical protein